LPTDHYQVASQHKNPSIQEDPNTTLWAMCCLAFFGFLRVSEFTILKESLYDPSCHLSLSDIAVDSTKKPMAFATTVEPV